MTLTVIADGDVIGQSTGLSEVDVNRALADWFQYLDLFDNVSIRFVVHD